MTLDELDPAYAILEEVTRWLLDQGVRQWLQPLPYESLRQRQQQGANFGLFADGELAAVVSLLDDRPAIGKNICRKRSSNGWRRWHRRGGTRGRI